MLYEVTMKKTKLRIDRETVRGLGVTTLRNVVGGDDKPSQVEACPRTMLVGTTVGERA